MIPRGNPGRHMKALKFIEKIETLKVKIGVLMLLISPFLASVTPTDLIC